MRITKHVTFEAAHILPWHKGKCSRLHGHTYHVEADVEGVLDENGIVADFSDLGAAMKEHIVEKYDHRLLNDLLENPTAERLAVAVYQELVDAWSERPGQIKCVRVWETPNSFVTYDPQA